MDDPDAYFQHSTAVVQMAKYCERETSVVPQPAIYRAHRCDFLYVTLTLVVAYFEWMYLVVSNVSFPRIISYNFLTYILVDNQHKGDNTSYTSVLEMETDALTA